MKVRINFDSNDFDEIVEFRKQIFELLHKIDSQLESFVESESDECDCDEDECPGHCCKCDENLEKELFISDAQDGCVTAFINAAKNKYGFCKEFEFDHKFVLDCIEYGFFKSYSDVDHFIKAIGDAKTRSNDNKLKKTIVEKLIKAGVTEAFAKHVVEHYVPVDPAKIPSEYSNEGFKNLMEYLGIKENFEEKKANEAAKALKEYLEKQIIEISKTDRRLALIIKDYFERFKPTKISDIDKNIETIKRIFEGPVKGEDSTGNVNTVDIEINEHEIRGQNKRPPVRKSNTDKKSDKTK